ncbi:MAG: hypothetical protein IT379_39825, partial [Deltaproteobacteria bacterium]|nr:hypothetical protein [Deltaproteobacteria bacterium]
MSRHAVWSIALVSLALAACGSRNSEYAEGAEPLRTESERGEPRASARTKANPHAPGGDIPLPGSSAAGSSPHGSTTGSSPHGSVTGTSPHGSAGPGAAPSGAPGEPTAGGVRWTVPDAFVSERPASSMRAAQYRVPRAQGDAHDAQITVFYFGPGQGGAVQDNIDRWVGQVQQPDGRPSSEVAQTDRRTVNGMPVTIVSVAGRLGGGGMPGMPPAPEIERGQLLGAIVEGPQGPVFFKMTGPAATVTAARA